MYLSHQLLNKRCKCMEGFTKDKLFNTCFFPFNKPIKDQAINDNIDHDDSHTEHDLQFNGEFVGINDGYDIMLYKSAGVTCLSPSLPELLLPGCQRTYPSLEFNQRCPVLHPLFSKRVHSPCHSLNCQHNIMCNTRICDVVITSMFKGGFRRLCYNPY